PAPAHPAGRHVPAHAARGVGFRARARMTTWLCSTCGTQYPPADAPPDGWPICEDERQYAPQEGQRWTEYASFLAAHRATIRDDHGILGLGCEPAFAIGQRALLVPGDDGNVLWDCIPLLDDELGARV